MSIFTLDNPHILKKIAVFFVFSFLCLILYFVLSFIPQISSPAQAGCYAIDKNSSCSSVGNEYYLVSSPSKKCDTYLPINTVCCCALDKNVATKPKYILIISITAFFAILTALVFFYKKNE